MKKLILVSLLIVVFTIPATAEVIRDKEAIQETLEPNHPSGGGTGPCSIVYYNLCSRWLWIWSGWGPFDVGGICFDLPNDCGKLPGETCAMTHFWWYWRYTQPTYGFTITYDLWEAGADCCKIHPSLCTIANVDPVERWNFHDECAAACITTDYAVLTAAFGPAGTLPYWCTTNNNKNYMAPNPCPGYTVAPQHSWYYGTVTTQYCPPYDLFNDGWGASNTLMDAGFTCDVGIGSEEASWGEIKGLFK
jgi:hypothetical protein